METCGHVLLKTFLELKHRIITTNNWTGLIYKDTSVSIIYRQFIVLVKQVGLQLEGTEPAEFVSSFEHGGFIKKRPWLKYSSIALLLEEYEPYLKDYTFWQKDHYRFWQMENLYQDLLSFKIKTVFRYYGALEGIEVGGAYANSLQLNALNKTFVDKIEKILEEIIDPDLSLFEKSKSVNDFDYPLADYETKYLQEPE